MSYPTYPTAADVENWLKSTGFWPVSDGTDEGDAQEERAQIQAGIAAAAAADEWEKLTGWLPFLADESASDRTFDETDTTGYLDFEGGAVTVNTVTVNGSALVLNTGYFLEPRNPRGRPYTGIQVGSRWGYHSPYGPRNSIVVNARWGYSTTVPADVWQAILQRASINTLRGIPNEQDIASISQDGFSKQLDIVGVLTQKDIAQGGDKDFVTFAMRYQRVVC